MKKCFKCNHDKELEEFYAHKQMRDGHLNKCKSCTRIDTKAHADMVTSTPEGREKERRRHREKYHRLGYRGKHKPTKDQKKKAMTTYRERYPEKVISKHLSHDIEVMDGYQRHHWSYNPEHAREIIEIRVDEHYTLHRHIVYDQERMMYRRCDNGELLDTRDSHIAYAKTINLLKYDSIQNR